VSLQSDKNIGTVKADRHTVLPHVAKILSELNIFLAKFVDKVQKLLMLNCVFFANGAVYDIMWESKVERDRAR